MTTTVPWTSSPAAFVQRSLLRNLVPFRIRGTGVPSDVCRALFLKHDHLIRRFLGSLESIPLPPMPRVLLAEAFQRSLEGNCPQRDLRQLLEDADIECRKVLLSDPAANADPVVRLLAFQLQSACMFYTNLYGISLKPDQAASQAVRHVVSSDIRMDRTLMHCASTFEGLKRNVLTGDREEDPLLDAVFQEYLMVERDCFGIHRFDLRGDKRHLLHYMELESITNSPKDFSLILDPIIRQFGNYVIETKEVHQGRWKEHTVRCGVEDHRVDPVALPVEDKVQVKGFAWEGEVTVNFAEPICDRLQKGPQHVEVFELAVVDVQKPPLLERWFGLTI